MNKTILVAVIFFLFSANIFAQQTLSEERREILKYGIDKEILDLIKIIDDEKTEKYDSILLELISDTRNSAIRIALSKYFREANRNVVQKQILDFLENYDLESSDAIVEFLEYVRHFNIQEAEDSIAAILDDIDPKLVSAAVVTLGAIKSSKYASDIWDLYESEDSDDNVKASVIRALGETGDPANTDFLTGILENTDEKQSFRWYACEALGKIGDKASIDLFYSVWNENDANMKTFVLKALKNFAIEDSYSLFEEALRDQNWRVRLEGIMVLGEARYSKALEIIEYKAKRDPELPVRQGAINAIGQIAGVQAFGFLREYIQDDKYTEAVRMAAVNILGEKDMINSAAVFRKMIEKEWDKEKSKMLDLLCKQFSVFPVSGYSDLFSIMIKHKLPNLRIYAIRGIGLNKITALKPEVEKFTTDNNSESIKRIARETLGQL
ncbi:MAG: HEAT repeat domain-containing protein [Spirochaetales bacterium]|nr:HEAT repeat domain-containing protein [Spirochaetales bacterium]